MIYGYVSKRSKRASFRANTESIKKQFPQCVIVEDILLLSQNPEIIFEGMERLLNRVKKNDTVVIYELSSFGRSPAQVLYIYRLLMEKGVQIKILKQPFLGTEFFNDTYKRINSHSSISGKTFQDIYVFPLILSAAEYYFSALQKTAEKRMIAIEEAIMQNKQIGRKKGTRLVTKKYDIVKGTIIERSKYFNGTDNDGDIIKSLGITRNTYYRYKKKIMQEIREHREDIS